MKTSLAIRRVYAVATALTIAIAGLLSPLALGTAAAGTLTKTTIQELGGASFANPMIASTGQELALDFKTVGAGATTASVAFTMGGTFATNGGSVNATQTISSTGCTTYFPSATLLPGSLAASGSGTTVSITGITALSATTEYCTILTSNTAVTNPSAGVYTALVTVGSDSSTAAYDVLSSGANAYSITASISPTFTMSLSSNTDSIATLSSGALTTSSGITITVNTNAANGWNLYAKDTNAGLTSATVAHTIASVAGGSNTDFSTGAAGPGNEAYGLGVSNKATANYAYGAGSDHGSALSSSAFNRIATDTTTATNVTTVLHELVNIASTTTPATDYTDTITVIGAGQF